MSKKRFNSRIDRWLAEREGFDPTAVLSTRAPKFRKKLPRPLAEDAARAMLDTVDAQGRDDWIAARGSRIDALILAHLDPRPADPGAAPLADHGLQRGPAQRLPHQPDKIQVDCDRAPRKDKEPERQAPNRPIDGFGIVGLSGWCLRRR